MLKELLYVVDGYRNKVLAERKLYIITSPEDEANPVRRDGSAL
jgi:hypothetical protein